MGLVCPKTYAKGEEKIAIRDPRVVRCFRGGTLVASRRVGLSVERLGKTSSCVWLEAEMPALGELPHAANATIPDMHGCHAAKAQICRYTRIPTGLQVCLI